MGAGRPRKPEVDAAVALVQTTGMSVVQAANECGVSTAGIYKRLNPERAEDYNRRANGKSNDRKRDWENAHRATCERCGKERGAGTRRSDGSVRAKTGFCGECRSLHRVETLREIVKLRRAGVSNWGIALKLDRPQQTIAQELSRCRLAGMDIPYDPYFTVRNPNGTGRNQTGGALSERDRAAVKRAFPDEVT